MQDYEKLGVFYLGRHHDLRTRTTLPDVILYSSNDLVTHALCVGMTGSGKTGLCFDLIEEAAIDGIPSILIDPKGDLGNLLLTFPELRPEDFEPWINPEEARRKGLAPGDFAAQEAQLWREGLARWNQDAERIRRLKQAADFVIYTPGSNAGLPVSILSSFAAPAPEIVQDPELLLERVNTTVASLFGLLGLDADPVRSREAVFLAGVLQKAWQDGRDPDLAALIQEIQSPRIARIGVMDVETFYPAKDRFALATALNALLASPGFSSWFEGEPLDIQRILHAPTGKPRVAIFSIAHLSDAERMFFVTLLLNQILGWMRAQSGTTSLRALVYMDEIFGYFPPVANPPSKLPLLTLLKQARAFGVGVVLATQNPVDLDYKGLANIGTWFLGRLQTDRDRQRVLDGLEGAATSQGSAFDRGAMEQTLAGLGNRVFLLHNVHEDAPVLFESRWAMSYLRGPMTRNQIKSLMDRHRASAAVSAPSRPPSAVRVSATPVGARVARVAAASAGTTPTPEELAAAGVRPAEASRAAPRSGQMGRPMLPPAVPQFFLPQRGAGAGLVYVPMILGAAGVRFADARNKVDVARDMVLLAPIKDDAVPVDWAEAQEAAIDPNDLERDPAGGAQFADLPGAASQARNYANWQKDLVNFLFGTRRLTLFKSPRLGQISRPDESEGDFRTRLQLAAREQRDAVAARLRAKYAPKLAALQERLRRAEQAVEREAAQAQHAKLSTALSFGSTLLGAFLGRKAITATNISKTATSLRGVGRSIEQSRDVGRATETVEAIKQQMADLDAQFQAETVAAEASYDPVTETLETIDLRPGKSNITVKVVALVWTPHVRDAAGDLNPAF